LKIAILVVSDVVSSGKQKNSGGAAVGEWASSKGWSVVAKDVVPGDTARISERLLDYCDRLGVELAFTTGGTGLSSSDVTPEATTGVADKLVPGLSEAARTAAGAADPRAVLSRPVSAVRGSTLIVNLPESACGARETLKALDTMLECAVEELRNGTGHE
jgi:molybdenum cofactor synthesis domain-containing protein